MSQRKQICSLESLYPIMTLGSGMIFMPMHNRHLPGVPRPYLTLPSNIDRFLSHHCNDR